MSHYNTGITNNVPSLVDMVSVFAAFSSDFIHVIFGVTQTSFQVASLPRDDPGRYDPVTRSWEGPEGLRYRVPLFPIPSERHTREKTHNIKILLDNCRKICVNDELPSTKAEREFWVSYRYFKYQMFLAPACLTIPPLYLFWRYMNHRIHRWLRGRTLPIMMGLAIAEQWEDLTFPGHQLLSTALRAETPMGDAARAEWTRLQPIDIPFHVFTAYQFHSAIGTVPDEYLFGGNIASLCQ